MNTFRALSGLEHAGQRALAFAARGGPAEPRFVAWRAETSQLLGQIFGLRAPLAERFNAIIFTYEVARPEMTAIEEERCFERGLAEARALLAEAAETVRAAERGAHGGR